MCITNPHPDPTPRPSVLILGAGLAGLSCGLSLARRGWSVTVLEKEAGVGGLAKTIHVAPDTAFDLGGHRLFTRDRELLRELKSLLDGEWTEVQRRSRIYLEGRFFDYPLKPRQALFSFGPGMSARILADYLWSHIRALGNPRGEETFEDWALTRFGKMLYRIFFQPYTEKVWGIPARDLSAHWSRERIDLLHLFHALTRAVFPSRGAQPRTYAPTFLYPRRGIGRVGERLAEQIRTAGGRILCGIQTHGMERRSGKVVSVAGTDPEGHPLRWTPHEVVSTIPLPEWITLLNPPAPTSVREAVLRLPYRHMIFVYILLSRERVSPDTWIYVPSAGVHICRIHEPKNWSEELVPRGMTSLCAEIFSSLGNGLWPLPDPAIVELVIRELEALGLIDPNWVLDSKVVRVPYTHPVYRVGYEQELDEVLRFVSGQMANFHLLGRTGAFQYKNMDQVMVDGFRLGESLHRRPDGPR